MQLPENAVILWQAAQNMLPGQSEDKCGEKYSSKNISNKIPFIPSGTNVMNFKKIPRKFLSTSTRPMVQRSTLH